MGPRPRRRSLMPAPAPGGGWRTRWTTTRGGSTATATAASAAARLRLRASVALLLAALMLASPWRSAGGANPYEKPSERSDSSKKKSVTLIESLRWTYDTTLLPLRLSDFSASHTIAPNDEGDIELSVYIVGGCEDSIRSTDLAATSLAVDSRPSGVLFPTCSKVSDVTYSYDPILNMFAKRRAMLRRRYRHAAEVVNGEIWIIGGRDENDEVVTEVELFKPALDVWVHVGDLPPDLVTSDLAVFARGDDLYVVGGFDRQYRATDVVFKIDTVATIERNENAGGGDAGGGEIVLSMLSPLNERRGNVQAVTYGHYAFVVGGYSDANDFCDPLSSVERYDMKNDLWTEMNPLREGRAEPGLVKYLGRVISIGGDTHTGAPGTCGVDAAPADGDGDNDGAGEQVEKLVAVTEAEDYDPLGGKATVWSNIPSTPHDGRVRFTAVPWPSTRSIYVYGGLVPGPEGCRCYSVSDTVLIYTFNYEEPRNYLLLIVCLVLGSCALGYTSFYARRKLAERRGRVQSREEEDEKEGMIDMQAVHPVT